MADGVASDLEQSSRSELCHLGFGHGQIVRVRRRCVEESAQALHHGLSLAGRHVLQPAPHIEICRLAPRPRFVPCTPGAAVRGSFIPRERQTTRLAADHDFTIQSGVAQENAARQFVPPVFGALADGTGRHEERRGHVAGRQSRLRLPQIVDVAVVECDRHGVPGQRAALEPLHKLGHREGLARAAKHREMLLEVIGLHGQSPGIDGRMCDAVVHENDWPRR